MVLVPADIGSPPNARQVTGTGLATGGGSFAADRAINVPAASQAEAEAGALATKALTPASIVGILAAIAEKVPLARTITTAGLATGGGNMTDDRTINVPKADATDVLGGVLDDRAVTPAALAGLPKLLDANGYIRLPGGLILQWGRLTANADSATTIMLPISFPTDCLFATVDGGKYDSGAQDNYPAVVVWAASSITIFSAVNAIPVRWFALGY